MNGRAARSTNDRRLPSSVQRAARALPLTPKISSLSSFHYFVTDVKIHLTKDIPLVNLQVSFPLQQILILLSHTT